MECSDNNKNQNSSTTCLPNSIAELLEQSTHLVPDVNLQQILSLQSMLDALLENKDDAVKKKIMDDLEKFHSEICENLPNS